MTEFSSDLTKSQTKTNDGVGSIKVLRRRLFGVSHHMIVAYAPWDSIHLKYQGKLVYENNYT